MMLPLFLLEWSYKFLLPGIGYTSAVYLIYLEECKAYLYCLMLLLIDRIPP